MSEDNRPNHAPTHVSIPAGSVVTAIVEVVEFMDPDTKRQLGYRFTGDTPPHILVGLLEAAKNHILLEALRDDHGDDD